MKLLIYHKLYIFNWHTSSWCTTSQHGNILIYHSVQILKTNAYTFT